MTESSAAARTPAQRTLLLVGSLGPLGHLPASGTVSVAIAGVPIAWCMRTYLTVWQYAIVATVVTAFAIWIHDVGDRILGEKDSRKLVIDELAGFFWATMLLPLPIYWPAMALAFFLERGIDILKIPPANWIEQRWSGGWGVVGDDVMAGFYTLGILYWLTSWDPTKTYLVAP